MTGQLEWILRNFQLDEVVLVVSKPHVFNLTGQLESIPPVFSTLAATDLSPLVGDLPGFFRTREEINRFGKCSKSGVPHVECL